MTHCTEKKKLAHCIVIISFMIIFTHVFVKAHTKNHIFPLLLAQNFIPHSIYFFLLLPCHCQSNPWFFTVLCVAVRAKVTCLAIDCILLHWFPYEIGSSTSLWQHRRGQCFMLPALFSPHTEWVQRAAPKQDSIDEILRTSFRCPMWQESGSGQVFY